MDWTLLLLLSSTIFPAPLTLARDDVSGTSIGLTYTATEDPSALRSAHPMSLMVHFKLCAALKSAVDTREMPTVGIVLVGTTCPNARFARSAILACTSRPSTSAVGSASANPIRGRRIRKD